MEIPSPTWVKWSNSSPEASQCVVELFADTISIGDVPKGRYNVSWDAEVSDNQGNIAT